MGETRFVAHSNSQIPSILVSKRHQTTENAESNHGCNHLQLEMCPSLAKATEDDFSNSESRAGGALSKSKMVSNFFCVRKGAEYVNIMLIHTDIQPMVKLSVV